MENVETHWNVWKRVEAYGIGWNRLGHIGTHKKMLSMHATAYITIINEAGHKMAIATIKKQSNFQLESSADI